MSDNSMYMLIPDDICSELGNIPQYSGKLKQKLQLDLAIGMYVSKEVSLSRAAEFSGLPLSEFTDLLCRLGLPVVAYSDSMLADDINFVKQHSEK